MHFTQFGDPILRQKARFLTVDEIQSGGIKMLIAEMLSALKDKQMGVGLAAPQIGESVAVAVICVQKTELRENVEPFSLTIINPKLIQTYGYRSQLWEGCISSGEEGHGLFARVPRYKKIKLEYYDEYAQKHIKQFSGLPAHVIQHEVDHLNGILFVDRVKDSRTYMTLHEYRAMMQADAN